MLHKVKPPTHKVILTGASLSIVLVGASFSFFFSSYSESNAAYSFTVDGRTGYIDDSGRTYDDSGVYRGDYNPSTGVYTSLDGASVNVNNLPNVQVSPTSNTSTTSQPSSSNTAYTFTVDGKTGRIDSDGKVYNDQGVYSGNFNPSTGLYTDLNGGSVNVNNTPNVVLYNSNGTEVPKTQTTSNNSSGDYTFTVDGKTGRIAPDGKTYDDKGVYQGNFNFTTGVYTDNNGSSINVNNTPGVIVRTSNGTVVPKTPTTQSTSNANLQKDYQLYWSDAKAGTVVNIGGGQVTRNADGTATYKNGNYTYTYSSSTPVDEVARNIPMLGQEWARTYGYTLPAEITSTTFNDFESFKAWEKRIQLNARFAPNYQTPDYIHMMGLSSSGDEEAFKRYVFFKTNPQYAQDYERIHQGQLSRYETDMTTIIKTDLTQLPPEYAEYYRNNPAELRAAEGFGFDPVLARKVYLGEIKVPYGVNATTWLQNHKWTPNGIVENYNHGSNNTKPYIGIDGKGSANYVQLKYDTTTGTLVGLDGTLYDPTTGEVKGKVNPVNFYGSGTTTTSSNPSSNNSNGDYRFTVEGKVGRITSDGKVYNDKGVYSGNYNFTTGIYTDLNGSSINVNNTPKVKLYNSNGTEVPKNPTTSNNSNGDYTFTVDGKTGRITSDGKVYNDKGVYSGNYNFITGIYTDFNGGSVNINNTPKVKLYNSNGIEVSKNPTTSAAQTEFSDFEEFKAWEKKLQLNARFASGYQTPDYVRLIPQSGNENAYKRYLFFKANPQYAEDYANIHQGKKSEFPTDGSTIIKTNLNDMPSDIATYYRNNPAELRAVEGFGFDPVLARKVYTGEIKIPYGVNASTWLQNNRWTPNGIVENYNYGSMNEKPFIGMNGTGANNYKFFKYDTTTGMIVDYDGTLRDPETGEAKGKVDPNTFYGSGAAYNTSNPSRLTAGNNTSSSTTRTTTATNTKINTSTSTKNSSSTNTKTNTSTSTKNSSSSTGSTNTYATLLPSSTVSKLNQFIVKIKEKRSTYSNETEYNAFLDILSIQLVELKTNQEFVNNTTFQNMLNYLIFEINQIRG